MFHGILLILTECYPTAVKIYGALNEDGTFKSYKKSEPFKLEAQMTESCKVLKSYVAEWTCISASCIGLPATQKLVLPIPKSWFPSRGEFMVKVKVIVDSNIKVF